MSRGSGWLPTTRFIHSMFFSMRATTDGHSDALWRCGSGSTWHCWQASLNDWASGKFYRVILLRVERPLTVLLKIGEQDRCLVHAGGLHARHHVLHQLAQI